MRIFDLPDLDGFDLSWRTLDINDVCELSTLIDRMEAVDNPPYRTDKKEVEQLFTSSDLTIAAGAFDNSNVLRAYGITRCKDDGILKVLCSGGVDPKWRIQGLGTSILDWEITVGRNWISSQKRPGIITLYVDDSLDFFGDFLSGHGFIRQEAFIELKCELQDGMETPEPDTTGRKIVNWSEQYDDSVRRVHNKLMEDNDKMSALSMEQWQQGRDFFVPEWSFVALDNTTDRSQVVGYILSARYDQDWQALGFTQGYTEELGVLPKWADTNLARQLLLHAMNAYKKAGMQYAGVAVPSTEEDTLGRLYEHLGFVHAGGSAMWMMEIPAET